MALMLAGADLRRAVSLLDPDLLAMTRRVLEAISGGSGFGYPAPDPYLGDWYEERGHDIPADLARVGWPITALRQYMEELAPGRRPVFTELYREVTRP